MIEIPANKYEEVLSNWVSAQLLETNDANDKRILNFLVRLLRCQMLSKDRGEMFPHISSFKISDEDVSLINGYSFTNSNNAQIKAYSLDLMQHKHKDKRQIQKEASLAYLNLYEKTKSPWFLFRSVEVRTIKAIKEKNFIKLISSYIQHLNGFWILQVCTALHKSYVKDELLEVKEKIENILLNLKTYNSEDGINERFCYNALEVIGFINKTELHRYLALSYEKEVDWINSKRESNVIRMYVFSIAQNAYNEIFQVSNVYIEDFNRISGKLIKTQRDFLDIMFKFGVKSNHEISNKLICMVQENIKNRELNNPCNLIKSMIEVSFIDLKTYDKMRKDKLKEQSILFNHSGFYKIGNKGQIVGSADSSESLDIYLHSRRRLEDKYILKTYLQTFFKEVDSFDENLNIKAIFLSCKSPYIPEERRYLWALGILEMMKNNPISSVHILMPQIEYALLKKAEYYCGSQTKLEQVKHQDEPSLDSILRTLKPYFKGVLYDEFRFFFNTGADENVRNKLAHGLCGIDEIKDFAPYLWWLAIKMYWCDDEIFIVKK